MQNRNVEVAIVGAGTAGMTAYRAALKHTDNLLVIESDAYGTTCARVGCMPSKLLIAAAEISHQVERAGQFGIEVGTRRVNGRQVMQRVRDERDRFVNAVLEDVAEWPEAHKLKGQARFMGPHELLVDGQIRVTAERIVLAVGSRPAVPEAWQVLGDRLLISNDLFNWQQLPASVAVVGTGVIGLELGQALARLGVDTRLFGVNNSFGPVSDPAVREVLAQQLATELNLAGDAPVEKVARSDDGVILTCRDSGKLREVEVDYLLAATGRRSNLDSVDLAAAGVSLDDRGMPAFNDATGQIEDSHLFIAGDASSAHPLLHEAADDGRIAGDNAGRFPDIRVHPRRTPLTIVFSDPQIMLTGRSHGELTRSHCRFATGEVRFEGQGRSRVLGRNTGILRVYGEHGSGQFLGAEMFGPAAEHIGHLLAWSVQQRLTVQQMLDFPYYHPVIEEGVRTALRRLNRALQMGPVPVKDCLDCGPGA
ncbi:MAG: dihydrolipoyl dehydrogenase [Gammaproteobacteria bacterium]|nr:dihydrolipoyl dehydrogenase [Pseudomonadales bacterium]MCP5348321.1 dihydrolipoyl dehydrogenase [Pseudomonadales bacterium]